MQKLNRRIIFFCVVAVFFVNCVVAYAAPRCAECARDDRGRIKRSASARAEFKKNHPCPATGRIKGACPGYVIDHVQPLKRGGADRPDNMQWQTKEDAKAKDKWE